MTDLIAADCGIRQLHARFADAVWRKDSEAFANCFTEAGEWKLAGLHMRGQSQLKDTFGKLLGVCDRIQFISGTPLLELGQGTASSRTQVTELTKMSDGSAAMAMGVYYDRYTEENGIWRFSWRHFSLHYRGPMDFSADLVPSPDYGPPPGLPPADEPTLTRRNQSS